MGARLARQDRCSDSCPSAASRMITHREQLDSAQRNGGGDGVETLRLGDD
jgi:hypothetical protein